MKRILVVITAGLVLASAGAQASQAVDDEAVVRQLESSWVKATTEGDKAVLERILDSAYIETTASGQRRSKFDVLNAQRPATGTSQSLTDVEVHLNGDTAVVTGTNQYRPLASAEPQEYLFTDVLIRRDGAWRAIASQMTRR
ncbi:nuclear transport factor 2 family protein [Burkholderia sp. Ax-1719]|uniref:nuclear transport factor 2 family protein n=1 Tax=Burkholderia sp. Ax-1719 TaxID=2608334 RepID=UPI00141E9EF5|nr:nuclear transport factor 2 family protein [Burkholderia sp. Ax-1719]NIE67938.1 nuclear transport factor 2 family protein [Burkholderia sp. Ax-1719]